MGSGLSVSPNSARICNILISFALGRLRTRHVTAFSETHYGWCREIPTGPHRQFSYLTHSVLELAELVNICFEFEFFVDIETLIILLSMQIQGLSLILLGEY